MSRLLNGTSSFTTERFNILNGHIHAAQTYPDLERGSIPSLAELNRFQYGL